mgnify:CR=1 FL=1
MEIFHIINPTAPVVPMVISCPHVGTYIPDSIQTKLTPTVLSHLDDTDWFVHQLYDFAPSLGITTIVATHHRWVVDLNRAPNSQALYNDGRVITGVVPTTDFNENHLYQSNQAPSNDEIQERIDQYFNPYHQRLEALLQLLKNQFGHVLLLDAHAIRKQVLGIQSSPFPDLILGNNDSLTSTLALDVSAQAILSSSDYSFSYNHPFKGGYLTRSFGQPAKGIYALQLEMAKTNYMDDSETIYDEARASKIKMLLKTLCVQLLEQLK